MKAADAAEVWKRRYERERLVRVKTEGIAERGVRELYERQRQLHLLQNIATAANQAATLPEALGFALREVAEYLTWPLAHALLVQETADGPRLVSGGLWHCRWPSLAPEFQRATESEQFAPGAGLPGRVLASGRPEWIRDVQADGNFPRAGLAEAADLGSGFAFPVLVGRRGREGSQPPGEEVTAVLEFFGTYFAEPGSDVLALMAQIGQQLGRVAERQRHQEELQHDACHDPLTGLPNRALLLDRLAQAAGRRKRRASAHFAVLFIDLDRFKVINDSLGHAAGDVLLQAVAKRLSAALGSGNELARMGGDEFTVLLEEMADGEEAARVAERLQSSLEAPFAVDGQEVYVTASIGIASSENDSGAEQMLRDADLAMYRAKNRGSGGYAIYDRQMHTQALQRMGLETELRGALRDGCFVLHYQPIVSTARDLAGAEAWSGMEALVRWRRRDGTVAQPEEFIGVAEETGLICPLGLWVMQEACSALRMWREQFGAGRRLSVGVNLSARQMAQPDLVERVARIVRGSSVPAEAIHLEITESVMLDNAERSLSVLRALKALGVRLSLDDFGTGYSSLSYLHRYPFDTIKIDRSFVSEMDCRERGSGRGAIVRTILRLAESLGMEVIAEGVEREEHLTALRRLGCRLVQGYYLSPPLPTGELEMALAEADEMSSAPALGWHSAGLSAGARAGGRRPAMHWQ